MDSTAKVDLASRWGGEIWIPAITAVIGAVVVIAGAIVARNATRYAANLNAQQARNQAHVSILSEFIETALDAVTAVQSYVHGVPRDLRQHIVDEEDWPKVKPMFDPALIKIQRARALSNSLIWPDVQTAWNECYEFLYGVIEGDDPDLWSKHTKNQPDSITRLLAISGQNRADILKSYGTVAT
jgi:hypothetical protein